MNDETRARLREISRRNDRYWRGKALLAVHPVDVKWLCDQLEAADKAGTFAEGVEAAFKAADEWSTEYMLDDDYQSNQWVIEKMLAVIRALAPKETPTIEPQCNHAFKFGVCIFCFKPTPAPASVQSEPRCKHCAAGLTLHQHASDGTWGHEFRDGSRAWCDECKQPPVPTVLREYWTKTGCHAHSERFRLECVDCINMPRIHHIVERATAPPAANVGAQPPIHPFEIRISIGGENWDYVVRQMEYLNNRFREHGPDSVCPSFGGGAGGSYSATLARRDVTVEQFHRELQEWFERQPRPSSKVEAAMPNAAEKEASRG